jgi:predicted nucleic acid-binding protein
VAKNNKPAAAEPQLAGGVRVRYVETSALVAAALEGDQSAVVAIRGEGMRIASALTLAETRRTFVVAGIRGRLTPQQLRTRLSWLRRFERVCEIVDITPSILARLGRPFPVEPVRSLDAIHMATVETIEEDPALIAIVTRDHRIAENARAMGYLVE